MVIKLMYEGGGRVRTQTILGVVWFLAADVCRILEIRNVTDAVEGLSPHQRNTLAINEGISAPKRGNPSANWVSLGGLCKLAFRSRKPEAVRFTDWMADEVAPSLWRHGCYPPPTRPMSTSRAQITARTLMHEEVDRRRAAGEPLDENEMAEKVAARLQAEHPEALRGCAAKMAHDIAWHKWVRESADELPNIDPQQPDLFLRYSIKRGNAEIPLPRQELQKNEIAAQILGPRYRARQASRKGIETTLRQDRALVEWWNRENPETPFTPDELRLAAGDLVDDE